MAVISPSITALIGLYGGRYVAEVMMRTNNLVVVKILTLRNKLQNSSILFARVFKKAQVVFSAIS